MGLSGPLIFNYASYQTLLLNLSNTYLLHVLGNNGQPLIRAEEE